MRKAIPLGLLGFIVGAVAGLAWGRKAKSNIGEAVSTDISGGVVTVQFDAKQAAKSGLADELQDWVNRW
ncbi:hypothetical protein [Marinobacter alkaliphilus]|uniref:hypothetical protein n=1 Tax=Marinobacter alkaliphilus TaxID=254719 RepID=UPI003D767198